MLNKSLVNIIIILLLSLSLSLQAQFGKRHEVKQGETVSTIAKTYQVSEAALMSMNPGIENELRVGQSLMIPQQNQSQPAENSEPVSTPKSEPSHQKSAPQSQQINRNGFTIQETSDEQREIDETATNEKYVVNEDKYIIYKVKAGETIYDIAKRFAVDIAELKSYNSDLTNTVSENQIIKILRRDDRNKDYITHVVEKNIKTKELISNWNVSETEFNSLNPMIARKINAGQTVYIPINYKLETLVEAESANDSLFDLKVLCSCHQDSTHELFRVALLIPLYLDQVDSAFVEAEPSTRMLKSRTFSFIQFYEGFMLAIDTLVKNTGLNLELHVYDIDQSIDKTQTLLNDSLLNDMDLIIGPFYSRSFNLVSEYAKQNNILIVNPLSTRENIIDSNPNVVKIKPDRAAQYKQLVEFVQSEYPEHKITIFSMNDVRGAAEADSLERLLTQALVDTVILSADPLKKIYQHSIKNLSKDDASSFTWLSVEDSLFATNQIPFLTDSLVLPNVVTKFNYVVDSIGAFKNHSASVLRDNLVIACGDDVVFATEMLNKLNMVADTFNITLIGLPEWGDFHQLFIENLMKINTIMFDDMYIDYNDFAIKMFIQSFRNQYGFEPEELAYQGYDIAWYFMKAFMRYGHQLNNCLFEFRIPLLGSQYYFDRYNINNGQSNSFWYIYQYRDFKKILYEK